MKPSLKTILSLLLCMTLASSLFPAASAETAENPVTVLDGDELQTLVEDFLAKERIKPELVSIGFLYTATGEECYYTPDAWYYSASLYKVPLTMCVADMVARGELEQTDRIGGVPLTTCEELILRHSSNDHAHLLMNWFWPKNEDCRALWPSLAGMEAEDFPQSFYLQSNFSAPFITRVFYTLYQDPDSYPKVLDWLLLAQPGEYLRRELGDTCDIAQKYGAYEQVQHISGIIYREKPIIVTMLTQYTTRVSERSGTLALMLSDYADTLDQRLEARQEQERLRAEEERRIEEQRLAEQERLREERERRAAEEAAQAEETEAPRRGISPEIAAAAAAVVLLLGGAGCYYGNRKRKTAVSQRENGGNKQT